MRRKIILTLIMISSVFVTACGSGAAVESDYDDSGVYTDEADGTLDNDTSSDNQVYGLIDDAPDPEDEVNTDEESIDLTAMTSTMVYAQVYSMLIEPESYLGKEITMDGTCFVYYDEENDKYYYSCIIQDATACCSQGIEFVLEDETEYPNDGDSIRVKGFFNTYEEDGYMYCQLKDADLI